MSLYLQSFNQRRRQGCKSGGFNRSKKNSRHFFLARALSHAKHDIRLRSVVKTTDCHFRQQTLMTLMGPPPVRKKVGARPLIIMLCNSAYLQIPYLYNSLLRNYVKISQHATDLFSKEMIFSLPQTFVPSVSTVDGTPPPIKKLSGFTRISGPVQKKVGGSGPAWTHCWRRR